MDLQNRLTPLNQARQAAQVDLVAIGPTANRRYLACKSGAELKCLAPAATQADLAMHAAVHACHPGISASQPERCCGHLQSRRWHPAGERRLQRTP